MAAHLLEAGNAIFDWRMGAEQRQQTMSLEWIGKEQVGSGGILSAHVFRAWPFLEGLPEEMYTNIESSLAIKRKKQRLVIAKRNS